MKIKIAHIILLMVSLVTIGCKKTNVYGDKPIIMQFGYEATGDEAMDSFVENDQIAMFVIDADKDPQFTDFNFANYIYKLTNVSWLPIDSDRILMWEQGAKPVFVYAYSPIAAANTPITAENTSATVLNVNMPLDQTSTNLKTLDLLYTQNKGANGEGLTLENNGSENVILSFKHKFCKVSISVFVKKADDIDGNVTLRSVQLKGTQLANEAKLDLHNAALNIVAPAQEQTTHSTKDIVLIPTDDFVEINAYKVELIILPFKPKNKTTEFAFVVNYNNNGVNTDKILRVKLPEYLEGGTQITFNENMQTVIKATLILNRDEVLINNTITDWGENNDTGEIIPT